ncbi:acyltransferase family protein [Rouxiella sp. Mn2063]|uniref:acyltransferase family protein n=1 Tax=Rouxiella sp. Mn2063 TaxID=3395262 RepID=UPI003BD69D40
MGLFRLLLAISVVIAHVRSVFYHNDESIFNSIISRDNTHFYILSGHSVFVFFIISGFFMSMVINEKYNNLDRGFIKFWVNRGLRLYPVNIALLVLMFLFYFFSGINSYLTLSLPDQSIPLTVASFFSNIFFFGAELITFNHIENWSYVNPQIWSLSLELYFYILAPLIVSRSIKIIFAIAMASFALRVYLNISDFPPVPWRYFFFPSDIVFFLIGVIAHRTKDATKNIGRMDLILIIRWVSLISVSIILFNKQFWPIARDFDSISSWVFFVCVAMAVPLLFSITKKNKIDNFLGHLSYPVYLGHMFIVTIVYNYAKDSPDKGAITLFFSLVMAISLYFLVDKPIEKLRKKITYRNGE